MNIHKKKKNAKEVKSAGKTALDNLRLQNITHVWLTSKTGSCASRCGELRSRACRTGKQPCEHT